LGLYTYREAIVPTITDKYKDMDKSISVRVKVCECCRQPLSSREIKEGKIFCQECEDHWNNE
jgi:hypothetical protein